MIETFGKSQQQLLALLLRNREGSSIDQISENLGVTRTAANQHIAALEKGGYVCRVARQETGGRPAQLYALTDNGQNLFPKQYSWFSAVLLSAITREKGSQGLKSWLRKLGESVAEGFLTSIESLPAAARIRETAAIMNKLSYEAESLSKKGSPLPIIEARNCVYHDLAKEHPEICQFDLALLSKLTGRQVDHDECMLRGGKVCRFQFKK